MQFRERNLRAVWPLILELCEAGNTREALDVLRKWFSVRDHGNLEPAFCIPISTGILWSFNGVAKAPLGQADAAANAVAALNQPIGSTFTDGLRGDLVPLQRIGVPDLTHGEALLEATVDYFGIERTDLIPMNGALSLIGLYGLPFPLQGAMLANLGSTLPISISLAAPMMSREIQNVGVWHAPVLHAISSAML